MLAGPSLADKPKIECMRWDGAPQKEQKKDQQAREWARPLEALGQNKKEKIRRSKRDGPNVGYLFDLSTFTRSPGVNKNINGDLVYAQFLVSK